MFHNLCVRITTGALLLASSAVLLGCSSSERQASPTADSSSGAAPSAPTAESGTAPGMTAAIDPKTGEFVAPTAAQRAAMESQGSKLQSTEERRQVESKLKNGRGTAITLEGDPETPLQACTNADGSVAIDHNCQPAKQPQQDK